MKKQINIMFSIIISLNFSLCSQKNLKIEKINIGSNLNEVGEISNKSLVYKFKDVHKGKKVKDLFNYIYFEGDTLCFSFKLNNQVVYNSIKVWFYNPVDGKSFPAERIDLKNKTISGFSLVGTILEQFYGNDLNKNLSENKYFNKDIDFIIKLSIIHNNKKIEKDVSGSFRLEYK